MKMKQVYTILISIMLLTAPLYAKEQLKPLTIQLNWVKNVEFAGLLLAKKRGWYEEAGIDLTVKSWQKEVSTINDVVSGKAQFGVADGSVVIKAIVGGAPVKAIVAIYQKTPYCLISKKKLNILAPAQLIGKKVGFNAEDSTLMIRTVLTDQGIDLKDITLVQRGWDVRLFVNDEIDVMSGFMNNEPLLLKELGIEVNYIPAFKYGYDFYGSVFFASDSFIQTQSQLIQAFLNVTMRGWREAFKTPQATAEMIVAEYYPKGSVLQQTKSLKIFHTLATIGTAVGDNMIGIMDKNYWQKGVDILHKFGQIDKKIPAKDLFTLKFVQNTFSSK